MLAAAFNLPLASRQEFFPSAGASWAGALLCLAGLVLLFLSLVSFGKSFRVGIDQDRPDNLVTTGVFAMSRNPIYVAFWFVLLGQFLLYSNWILLVYLAVATRLFHRQVRREEEFTSRHYGEEYSDYCARVRRYLSDIKRMHLPGVAASAQTQAKDNEELMVQTTSWPLRPSPVEAAGAPGEKIPAARFGLK